MRTNVHDVVHLRRTTVDSFYSGMFVPVATIRSYQVLGTVSHVGSRVASTVRRRSVESLIVFAIRITGIVVGLG